MINIEKYIHKTVGGDEKIQDFSHINSEIYKRQYALWNRGFRENTQFLV